MTKMSIPIRRLASPSQEELDACVTVLREAFADLPMWSPDVFTGPVKDAFWRVQVPFFVQRGRLYACGEDTEIRGICFVQPAPNDPAAPTPEQIAACEARRQADFEKLVGKAQTVGPRAVRVSLCRARSRNQYNEWRVREVDTFAQRLKIDLRQLDQVVNVSVRPQYQHQGIGTALLSHVLALRGRSALLWTTELRSVAFYRRLSFKVVHEAMYEDEHYRFMLRYADNDTTSV